MVNARARAVNKPENKTGIRNGARSCDTLLAALSVQRTPDTGLRGQCQQGRAIRTRALIGDGGAPLLRAVQTQTFPPAFFTRYLAPVVGRLGGLATVFVVAGGC